MHLSGEWMNGEILAERSRSIVRTPLDSRRRDPSQELTEHNQFFFNFAEYVAYNGLYESKGSGI